MNTSLQEHQLKAIEALGELDRICRAHGLTFFLIAGSALGAVRHQGMIPWDDDIDVGLTYEDWHKLRKILPQELQGEFQYIDNDVDPDFPRLFGKILWNGRNCVDLFLIAKWTDDPVSSFIHWHFRRIAVQFYKYSMHYHSPHRKGTFIGKLRAFIAESIRKILYYVTKIFFTREDYVRLARWNEKYFEGKDTGYYINLYSIYSRQKEMLKAEWVEELTTLTFEGKPYKVVGHTHDYLTHLYGDYMTPPKEKMRYEAHKEIFTKN